MSRSTKSASSSFKEVAHRVLPDLLRRLAKEPAIAVTEILSRPVRGAARHLPGRIAGLYVFYEGKRPFYVGISRHLRQRIRQHVAGKGHNDASLAYLLACGGKKAHCPRAKMMSDENFVAAFRRAQSRLRDMTIRVIPVHEPIHRYLLEVYAAMELGTLGLNSFETH